MKFGKMVYRGTIAVDIDGVLADFEGKFCEDFGYKNRHIYKLGDRYPDLDRDLILEYVQNPSNYVDLAPIFGGLLFTRQAHTRGWYILLVTARDRSLREVTKNWLAKYSVVYHELYFAKNKREAIQDFDALNPTRKVAIVVDDSVSVLESMPEKYGISWWQEWNIGYHPSMWYESGKMKLYMQPHHKSTPVGVWDRVGK